MATLHISEADAKRDFSSLLARVRSGVEVVIERDSCAVAVMHTPAQTSRSLSDCIELARRHEEEIASTSVLDAEFASDVEEIVQHRKPWTPPEWE